MQKKQRGFLGFPRARLHPLIFKSCLLHFEAQPSCHHPCRFPLQLLPRLTLSDPRWSITSQETYRNSPLFLSSWANPALFPRFAASSQHLNWDLLALCACESDRSPAKILPLPAFLSRASLCGSRVLGAS